MPLSEAHETLVKQLIDLTGRVREMLKADDLEGLDALAEENKRLMAELAVLEFPEDSDALEFLVHARDCIQRTRSALQSKRDVLAEEIGTLETRKRVGKTYGANA